MAQIRIYIARHLCTAPRPQKEADALAAAGHEVSIHGMTYRADFNERDAAIAKNRAWSWSPAVNFTPRNQRIAWQLARLSHRAAKEYFTLTRRIQADVWGYATRQLCHHALTASADLTLVHSEGGLWMASLLRQRGYRVGVDFEDWFSQDLTPEQRRARPVEWLAQQEIKLLQTTPYALTTSHAMADAMSEAFHSPAPAVIYNTFPESSPPPPCASPADGPVRLHWFSLVLGPERGLEALFTALPRLMGNWQLHLRGEVTPEYRERLLALVPRTIHPRIHFHEVVSAGELPHRISENDIGLALDVSSIPSRNLTITNKVFQYLQAGLALIASDTAGHREVMNRIPQGILFPANDSLRLAEAINFWIANRNALQQARQASRQAFVEHFSHERQQFKYAELADQALTS